MLMPSSQARYTHSQQQQKKHLRECMSQSASYERERSLSCAQFAQFNRCDAMRHRRRRRRRQTQSLWAPSRARWPACAKQKNPVRVQYNQSLYNNNNTLLPPSLSRLAAATAATAAAVVVIAQSRFPSRYTIVLCIYVYYIRLQHICIRGTCHSEVSYIYVPLRCSFV